MKRRIIEIDQEACNGCGACAAACHEGAVGMVDGKARLLRDDYCDGLGDCLPTCPTGAIRFVEREAVPYDEAAVKAAQAAQAAQAAKGGTEELPGQLRQWPVQIKLAPIQAPYYQGADLLVSADCAAYAYGNFHNRFIRGRVTLIGCPKLDGVNYAEKLTEILRNNDIRSVTVVRMEVPCCGGLEQAVKNALQQSGKFLPWQVVTLSVEGEILGNPV